MARVTYGESITEYTGSIGGVTFLRNASGPIAKLRSNPPVNPSPYQSTYQTNLAKLVAYWPTLSQYNKHDWDLFAAAHLHTTPWGKSKTLSGYQWFLSINLNRLLDRLSPLPAAPAFVAYQAPDNFTFTYTSLELRCNWDPPYSPINTLKIFLTLPLRQSSLKLRRSLFYVGKDVSGGPFPTLVLTTQFEALANITWADFWNTSDCSIICRLQHGAFSIGQFSAFTSAIVKISPV